MGSIVRPYDIPVPIYHSFSLKFRLSTFHGRGCIRVQEREADDLK